MFNVFGMVSSNSEGSCLVLCTLHIASSNIMYIISDKRRFGIRNRASTTVAVAKSFINNTDVRLTFSRKFTLFSLKTI